MTVKHLEEMSQSELEKPNRTELVDIRTINIDTSLPLQQRITDYLEKVKNPYYFLCGETTVHIRFEPRGDELKNKLKNLLINSKKD